MKNRYHIKQLTDKKIDDWLKRHVNVLLIGEKGTGKSTSVIEGFTRNNLNWVYFSGATMDPWTDLIGIPHVTDEDGSRFIDYVLPKNINEDVEIIFIDEFNRTPKKVRNALMELQQFKSINGRKFPNLKAVWAAVNPWDEGDDDDFGYDTEHLDPAQMDRFQVIVNVPNSPSRKYFKTKYGTRGVRACKWWEDQGKEVQKEVSPRRLDYAVEYHLAGGGLDEVLPKNCNLKALVDFLELDDVEFVWKEFIKNPTDSTIKDVITNTECWQRHRDDLFKTIDTYAHLVHNLPQEEFEVLADQYPQKLDYIFQSAESIDFIYDYVKGICEYSESIKKKFEKRMTSADEASRSINDLLNKLSQG